jgi:serine protease AprX
MQLPKVLATLLVLALVLPATGDVTPRSAPLGSVFHGDLASDIVREPNGIYDALVTLTSVGPADVQRLQGLGLSVLRVFDAFDVMYVVGAGADLQKLGSDPGVLYVIENQRLQYHDETSLVTTRTQEAWDAKSTSTNPVVVGGQLLDGTGIGVAYIDTGIDATHPDLAPATGASKKFVCASPGLISTLSNTCYADYVLGTLLNTNPSVGALTTGNQPVTGCSDFLWADGPMSDQTSGHGTHVAGIIAGRGVASDGRLMGAAPGATLYALGVGEGISVLFALEGYNWVHCHYNSVSPAIRVVSNSWGTDGPAFDAADPVNTAITQLVADGLVVTFSAGNSGGTGTADLVNTYCKNPVPGVICVASYNDAGIATRAGSLSGFSSRGLSTDPNADNWPDVSAPGDTILSTLAKAGPVIAIGVGLTYAPYYAYASGTSMASPAVAGAVALLVQANPSLTPADVEDVLEDSSVQFATTGGYASADPSNPTNGINFASGHGLIDTIAALQDARVLGTAGLGSPLPQVSSNPHLYSGGLDGEVVAGAPPTLSLQWTEVEGQTVLVSERTVNTGNAAAYPLAANQAARMVVSGPNGFSQTLNTLLVVDGNGGFRVNANWVPPATAGSCLCVSEYVFEAQVKWGASFVSFDRFVVRVV